MNLSEYARWTDDLWKSGQKAEEMDDTNAAIVAMGLAGETGEAIEYVKKYLRDGKSPRLRNDIRQGELGNDRAMDFGYELGDILYYWCRLVRWAGFDPMDVLKMNVNKLEARHPDRRAKVESISTDPAA